MTIDDIAQGFGGISEEQRRRLAARVTSDAGMSPEVRDAVITALRPQEWVDLCGFDAASADGAVDMPALVTGLRIRPRDHGHGGASLPEVSASVPADLFYRSPESRMVDVLSALRQLVGGPSTDIVRLPTLARYRREMTFGELFGEGIRFQDPILLCPPNSLAVSSEAKLYDGSPWVAQMLVVASPLCAFHEPDVRRRSPVQWIPWTTPAEAVALIRYSPAVAKDLWDVLAVGP